MTTTGPIAFQKELSDEILRLGTELNTTINIQTHWDPYGLIVELWAVVPPAPGSHETHKVGLRHIVPPKLMDNVPAKALVYPILKDFENGLRVELAGLVE